MITYIIGKRSLLSKNIQRKIIASKIVSSDDFLKLHLKSKVNLIVNLFYPSQKIKSLTKYDDFIYQSLSKLVKGLDGLNNKNINKIIYTSSSAVYGLQEDIRQSNDANRKIYSASKLLAENLIINFCNKNNIHYAIARVFNLYGANDEFSIISKLIKANNNDQSFVLNNNGSAVRDFINYEEVSNIYNDLLKSNKSEIVDVGTGYGTQIKDIINLLNKKRIKLKKQTINEIQYSVSDLNVYNSNLNKNTLNNFLKSKLKLKYLPNVNKHTSKNNNYLKDIINGTIIYGAGNAGKQIFELLSKNNENGIYCFVDDNKNIQNSYIKNKKIISFENLKKLSKRNIVSNVIIAIPSLKKNILEKKIGQLKRFAINVNYLPLKRDLLSEIITIDDINYSNLKDIFERKVYDLNSNLLSKFKNKTILVTGAAGSIGNAICNKLKYLDIKNLIALDKSEIGIYNIQKQFDDRRIKFVLGDINQKMILSEIKKKYKIDIVFHAAAYKHLNILEENVCEAVRNNVFGTLNIIDIFKEKKIVIISTDKAAKPRSILGLTKRISEILCLNYENKNSKIVIVRFGNVFASQGSAINLFLDQIKSGGPVTLTHKKAERYFMSSSEAANLVLQGSQLNYNRKILILDMGKQIKLFDIIKKLIQVNKVKDPLSNIKIKYIGLKKGEKIKEKLFLRKIKRSKYHKNILIANEPIYTQSASNKLLSNLNHSLIKYDKNKIIKIMKNFLKKEI